MEIIATIAVNLLAMSGTFLILIAGLGVLRMPDLPTRMHASSKAGTLGTALLLMAVAVYAGDLQVTFRAVLICLFLFLTAPVAAHMIARAAYHSGVPLSDKTVVNELRVREFDGEAPQPNDDGSAAGEQGDASATDADQR